MDQKQVEKKQYAETYGGILGGLMPLLVMVVIIAVLSIVGMRDAQNFWCAGFLGVLAGFVVFKDKGRYQKALLDGVRSPTFAMTILILVIASVIGQVFAVSHLGEGLLYALSVMNVPAAVMPLAAFLVGSVISTASGSSSVVVLALIPVLYPVGVQMGCHPGVMLGAVASGAAFGDNLAPISDSTLTSALTQDADVNETVKDRFKYSLAAFIPAVILFLVAGFMTTDSVTGAALNVDSTYVGSLVFLALPVLLIVMILKKVNFLVALMISDIVGIVMLLLFGYIDLMSLFSTEGVIVSGISGVLDAIIFMLFIFIILALTQEAGVLDKFQEFVAKRAKTERAVESTAGLFTLGICVLTTSSLSTMAFCGPIVKKMVEPYKIVRTRAANYLCGIALGVSLLLPYGSIPVLIATIASMTGVVEGGLTAMDFVGYNFYCMAMVIVYLVAIWTGWGRKHEEA